MDTTLRLERTSLSARSPWPAGSIAALVQRWVWLRAGPVHRGDDDWLDTVVAAGRDGMGGSTASSMDQKRAPR